MDSYMHPEGGEVEVTVYRTGRSDVILELHGKDAGSVKIFRMTADRLMDLGTRIFEHGRRLMTQEAAAKEGCSNNAPAV